LLELAIDRLSGFLFGGHAVPIDGADATFSPLSHLHLGEASMFQGIAVLSCPDTVKASAADIQALAQFRPNPTMPHHQWWLDQLAKTSP